MKVVFLDFDGVVVRLPLQNGKIVKADGGKGGLVRNANPENVEQLNRLLDETGAVVVVSSTWRKHHTIPMLWGTLGRVGFRHRIVGTTPVLGTDRGYEVADWLARHPEVTSYVVLDDDGDIGPIPADRWVLVREGWFKGGLLAEHVDRAIIALSVPVGESIAVTA